MTAVGWVGVWLLVASLALLVFELALFLPRLVRLGRRALVLQALLDREDAGRRLELSRRRALQLELDLLLRPYRRGRRWLRHPLTLALFQSYRRRRART
jgi:hypothetical protein